MAPPPDLNPCFDDPTGDIAVISCDVKQARVSSLHLRASSQVFFDMVASSDADTVESKTAEGLPCVRVAESANDIGCLLKLALHPRPAEQAFALPVIQKLLKLADKYAMPQATTAALSLLCGWLPAEAPTVFALAVIHGHLSIARCALGSFESKMPGVPSYQQGRSRSLAEVPEALFDEIPRVAFRHYLTLQDLFHSSHAKHTPKTWVELARGFQLTGSAPSVPTQPADPYTHPETFFAPPPPQTNPPLTLRQRIIRYCNETPIIGGNGAGHNMDDIANALYQWSDEEEVLLTIEDLRDEGLLVSPVDEDHVIPG